MKPVKYAIAYTIYNKDRSKILIVQRPSDDENFPSMWGLPAGLVRDDETFEEAVIRSGREKLGVELKIIGFIGRGDIDRGNYVLHMEEYETEIIKGKPEVPQPYPNVTQYKQWRWGNSSDLKETAKKGSLCCRIYLSHINEKW